MVSRNVSTLVICPECDLANRMDRLSARDRAHCARCDARLGSGLGEKLDLALAVLLTAAILSAVMNYFPLVTMHVQGVTRATTLSGAALALGQHGMLPLGLLVFATTVLGPIVEIGLLSLALVPARVSQLKPASSHLIGLIHHIHPWSMVEVFLLGVLVSLVKLSAVAEIIPGPALWACAGLIVAMSFLKSIVRPEDLWAWSRASSS